MTDITIGAAKLAMQEMMTRTSALITHYPLPMRPFILCVMSKTVESEVANLDKTSADLYETLMEKTIVERGAS